LRGGASDSSVGGEDLAILGFYNGRPDVDMFWGVLLMVSKGWLVLLYSEKCRRGRFELASCDGLTLKQLLPICVALIQYYAPILIYTAN